MATRKGTNISGNYVLHHEMYAFLHMYFVFEKIKTSDIRIVFCISF